MQQWKNEEGAIDVRSLTLMTILLFSLNLAVDEVVFAEDEENAQYTASEWWVKVT